MFDMREYIEQQLDLWDLGKLISVVGPDITKKSGEDYYELTIKYRPNHVRDGYQSHFDHRAIVVNIGYTRKGGYWNRRCIRLAVKEEGMEQREVQRAKVVWSSAQRELTTGKNASGAFEL